MIAVTEYSAEDKLTAKDVWMAIKPSIGAVIERTYADGLKVFELAKREPDLFARELRKFEKIFVGERGEAYIAEKKTIVASVMSAGITQAQYIICFQHHIAGCTSAYLAHTKLRGEPLRNALRVITMILLADASMALHFFFLELEQQNRRQIAALGEHFEKQVATLAIELDKQLAEAAGAAGDLSTQAKNALAQTKSSQGRPEHVTAATHAVETATASMRSSIEAISDTVRDTTTASGDALNQVKRASSGIAELATARRDIETATGIITKLAAQTNLLALNATIEAARAGETGRGFAVVAAEVKALASETNKAAGAISQSIAALGHVATGLSDAVTSITSTVTTFDDGAQRIRHAIEDQANARRTIFDATETSSAAIAEMSRSNEALEKVAENTAQQANRLLLQVSDSRSGIVSLGMEIETFSAKIKATEAITTMRKDEFKTGT
jgi:methyl-accepting chemotaxis protein